MIVRVTYVADVEVLGQPITKEGVEEAFFGYIIGETSMNDREVSLTWKIVED